jgi:hypothetical protein
MWLCTNRNPSTPGCLERLEQDLASVPALWRELGVTLTRQDAVGSDGGRRSAEVALPFKSQASEARWLLGNTIGTWARVLAESHALQAPATPARWLLLNVHSLAMHEAAAEAVDEIGYAVRNAYRVIDRPPERLLAGVCSGTGVISGCEAQLYARPGDTHAVCEACGTVHEVVERREAMVAAASELLVTATVALGWVRLLMDKTIPRGTWDSWTSRKQIFAHGVNMDGRETYRFGEVHDLALRWARRTRKVAA